MTLVLTPPVDLTAARRATDRHPLGSLMFHVPVMVNEVLSHLLDGPCDRILDATLGGAGHARAILTANPEVRLVGLDRDTDALAAARDALAGYESRVELIEGNFGNLGDILAPGDRVDGVVADLGVSSMQLDTASRGFSYMEDGPLDMRAGGPGPTAREFLARSSVAQLKQVLREYGEVTRAGRIARSLREAAERNAMETTADLRTAVDDALAGDAPPFLLSRVFQAIRIAVNEELGHLDRFLDTVLDHLNPAARIVIISYHSLEDRRVKHFFKRESTDCICPPEVPVCVCQHRARIEVMTRRAVRPSPGEVARNARARSARLRAAKIIGEVGR